MASWVYNRYVNPYSVDNLINNYVKPWFKNYMGYNQMKNTQESYQAEIGYQEYLKGGYNRALSDWHKNVPNRKIRYPEFSYPGQIRRADTSIVTATLGYNNAYSNYEGNILGRAMGLYGVPGRVYRSL